MQKWVRCRFADWVVASDENWHNGYDGLLNEYQLALLRRGEKDLTRKTWWEPGPHHNQAPTYNTSPNSSLQTPGLGTSVFEAALLKD